ncbi:MAG: hypothetical protein JNK01_08600 [Devosia sp.]|nr:hypothetical protein [Devosia sp.]
MRGALSAIAIILSTSAAFADTACVQQELTRLGFDPGPVDGSLGKKTLSAASKYQLGAAYLPDLSRDTTYVWCKALRERPNAAVEASTFPTAGASASSGATSVNAMGTTPILGVTPEYQVPGWVNNPH